MPKYRMMYIKKGTARYISHLDLLRAFERAARRAGLPMAFTQGFNPHPKISFAAPLAVGMSGEAEFADFELTVDLPAGDVARALSVNMPQGLGVVEVRKAPDYYPPLMSLVERATYRAEGKLARPVDGDELKRHIENYLSQAEILVDRKKKTGESKKYDIRPGIFAVAGRIDNDIIVIEAELKTGSSGNVRFEELLSSFQEKSGLPLRGKFALKRTGLFASGEVNKKNMMW